MRVLVLGAGVVGVAAAWYLSRAGHAVTVVDRQPGPGLETSFANGGQVSPCHADPWANPSTPKKILKWLGRKDAPLLFHWDRWDPALWAWGLRFLANCTAGRARVNTERTLRVALYSRACLQELRTEIGLDYDQRTRGILHVYRDSAEFAHACRAAEVMQDFGLRREVATATQALAIEPALAPVGNQLAGAIYTPDDESGDAHLFTTRLAALAAERGVEFRFGVTAQGLMSEAGRITGLVTDAGPLTAEAYVLAAASHSPGLLRGLGLRLPIVPAKGYSLTLEVEDPAGAPTVSITDDEVKMVYSRLGNRLRAAGTAEMAGHDARLNPVRTQALVERARGLFPRAGDYAKASLWAGLRPVTPDSVPILGATPYGNLWLNTGHGTLGWTMACGSGAALADLISGRQPEMDMTGLGIDRF